MTTLRQRMIDDLKIRNRSARTIKAYIACVANFARHFGKSPELLGPEEIRQYQVYLVNERHVSWSNFNQAVCALRFLYRHTLERDWAVSHIPYPRQPQQTASGLKPGRSQALLRRHPQTQVSGPADDCLCGWSAALGSHASASLGYRLAAHGDPRAAGQGPEGSLRDARAHSARGAATLLAAGATNAPGSFPVRTGRQPISRQRGAESLSPGWRRCRA